jgi:dTMP kinase
VSEQPGSLIILEGLDGAGKATQAKKLRKRLSLDGHKIKLVHFPRYGEPGALMLEAYLNGEFGDVDDLTARQVSIFYACDRFGARDELISYLEDGYVVICDRYVTANKGHQLNKVDEDDREAFLDWLERLEYEIFDLPSPDKVFFLDVTPETSQQLTEDKRDQREGKEIHEDDLDHLRRSREAFHYVKDRDNWDMIRLDPGGDLRSIDEIHGELTETVKAFLSHRKG